MSGIWAKTQYSKQYNIQCILISLINRFRAEMTKNSCLFWLSVSARRPEGIRVQAKMAFSSVSRIFIFVFLSKQIDHGAFHFRVKSKFHIIFSDTFFESALVWNAVQLSVKGKMRQEFLQPSCCGGREFRFLYSFPSPLFSLYNPPGCIQQCLHPPLPSYTVGHHHFLKKARTRETSQ